MRVLITGAAGFVGRHLIRELAKAGAEVVATSRNVTQIEADIVEKLDVLDGGSVADLFLKLMPAAVIHLAAQAAVPESWERPSATFNVNVVGTANVLEGLRGVPKARLLHVGTGHQYAPAPSERALTEDDPQQPTTPYSGSKIAAEQLVRMFAQKSNTDAVIARAFNHTGPGQEGTYAVGAFSGQIVAIERGQSEKRIDVGNLSARRDFLDVRDVVTAYRILLDSGAQGQAYNVCSGNPVSMRSVLDKLLEIAGLLGDVEVLESKDGRPGDIDVLYGDPSKIKRLGWQMCIPFEDSLRETLDWYRAQNR